MSEPLCRCKHARDVHISIPANPGQLAGCQECGCPQFRAADAPASEPPTLEARVRGIIRIILSKIETGVSLETAFSSLWDEEVQKITVELTLFAQQVARDERRKLWAYIQKFMEGLHGKPFADDGSTFEDHLRTMLVDEREWAAQQCEDVAYQEFERTIGRPTSGEYGIGAHNCAAAIRKGCTPAEAAAKEKP